MSGNRQYKLSASNIGWDKKDDPRVIARMKELGYQGLEIAPTRLFPDTPYAHRNMAAMLGIDYVVAIGAKAAKIADGTAQSGGEVLHFATKEEAIPTLREQLGAGTAMLVKASHSMHFGALVDELRKSYD